jgi:riboflavin synthase
VFTGIIEEIGRIAATTPLEGGRRLRVECSFAHELRVDESVAVDGACLTVVAAGGNAFEAVAVEETLTRTTLGGLKAGDAVNLERAVALGHRLDGHLVQGHVDGRGVVDAVREVADSRVVLIAYPPEYAAYLVEKGSVAVDGVSLTIAGLDEPAGTFAVAIIPHTLARTNAARWQPGAQVNLEYDLVGKYVLRARALADSTSGAGGADTDARSELPPDL